MTKNRLTFSFLIFLLFITALQFSSFGIVEEVYELLRLIIIVGIALLFLISYRKPLNYYNKVSVFKTHSVLLVIFSVILFVLYAFGADVSFAPIRDLAISLVVLMIGLNMNISKKQYKRLVTIFIILYTLSALSIIFTFASGFIIYDQYLPIPKNQLAPVFGVAFILSIYFGFKQKGLRKWLYYILSVLLLSSLLVIRGRAVIVAVFITSFIFIFYYVRGVKYRFVIIAVILIALPFAGQFVYDALFLNYDITDLDSISTGRMERNIMGLEFLFEYPLTGELYNTFKGNIIHNYLLITLVSYGVILASLLLVIYFKYMSIVINSIKKNSFEYYEVAPLVMAVLLIVSLFEYTYPYGPGSATFFPFFLMGLYFKNKNIKNKLFQ